MLEPGRGGKWVCLRYILNAGQKGLGDGLNSSRSEAKARGKDDSPRFGMVLSVHKMGKTPREGGVWGFPMHFSQ